MLRNMVMTEEMFRPYRSKKYGMNLDEYLTKLGHRKAAARQRKRFLDDLNYRRSQPSWFLKLREDQEYESQMRILAGARELKRQAWSHTMNPKLWKRKFKNYDYGKEKSDFDSYLNTDRVYKKYDSKVPNLPPKQISIPNAKEEMMKANWAYVNKPMTTRGSKRKEAEHDQEHEMQDA